MRQIPWHYKGTQSTAHILLMSDSIPFYDLNAKSFFNSTVDVDTQSLYQHFLPNIKEHGHILDAGCGSGRDAKAFLELGYQVTAFDGSKTMAMMASKLTGLAVKHSLFKAFHSEQQFDGIWACASLLHVPYTELSDTFTHLASFLKMNGTFYCSFKLGENHQITRNGRVFTDLNYSGLVDILSTTPLKINQHWQTSDLRPDRTGEQWLNALLTRI